MDARSGLSAISEEAIAADNAISGHGRIVADELGPSVAYLDAVIEEWTREYPIIQKMEQNRRDPNVLAEHLSQHCPKLQELLNAPERGDYRIKFVSKIKAAAKHLLSGILA